MKKSNGLIEDSLKKALDEKSKEGTAQMNILERNAKFHHVLQEDFKARGLLENDTKRNKTGTRNNSKRRLSPVKQYEDSEIGNRTAVQSLEKLQPFSA